MPHRHVIVFPPECFAAEDMVVNMPARVFGGAGGIRTGRRSDAGIIRPHMTMEIAR
jgi:hypothetical protein